MAQDLLRISYEERPSHRYDPKVSENQTAIDEFLKLHEDSLMEAPIKCLIYLIDEETASGKALREHQPELALYLIWFSDKISQVIVKRQDELSPEILTKFGLLLQYGNGCVDQGPNAVKVYKAAAKKGFVLAQYYLGYMYHNGSGIPQDNVLAREWYTIAAQNGHPHAQHSLKFMDLNEI